MQMRKGFTLIELLVVIAIIGILATLVITQVAGAQIRARNANAKSDVNQIGKAVELFKNDDTNGAGTVIRPATTAAGLTAINGDGVTGGTAPTVFTGMFTGTMVVGASNNATSRYGVNMQKVVSSSTAYTYTYATTSAAAGTIYNNDATCYVIHTTAVNIGSTTVLGYKILNGANSDQAAAPTSCI
jgi:prepilin-type N-terminal cleavage/methylation domain-containing protein